MPLDLDAYLPIPRLAGLRLAPDGERMLFTAATPTPKGTAFATALWSLGTDMTSPARRLTAPREGDALVGVLPDGSALLVSGRPDPEAAVDADEEDSGLWLLPRAGGEPRHLLSLATAPRAVAVARAAGTMALLSEVFPQSATLADDRALATRRKEVGTGALLFEDYPIRFWDRHLGPRRPRLFALPAPDAEPETSAGPASAEPLDLTGPAGQSLVEASMSVLDDGSAIVTTWRTPLGLGAHRVDLMLIPTAGGQHPEHRGHRVVAAVDDHDHDAPAVSPDSRWVVASRSHTPRPDRAPAFELWLYPLDPALTDEPRQLAADLDRWPGAPLWSPDGATVYVTADDEGNGAVYAVDVAGGPTRRVSADGALSDVSVSPDGTTLFALRSRIGSPPEVVSLDAAGTDVAARVLHAVPLPKPLAQRVEQVRATAEDGTPLRAWLVLPETAAADGEPAGAPAPLLVTIHGGPLGSWNAWQWRWQPALFTASGYAVLLPDPALSTGYGQQMVDRGWHQWGGTPYTDVMALTDAAVARPDVDGERAAVIGGSYGGYLTNWVIGHTDRFRAAVTHASLWSMGQFHGTTDDAIYWEQDWGDPRRDHEHYARWSPDSFVDEVRTPTLVIHGERDYRVPVSEGLRLWTDLQRRGVPSQLLYLPDENHWVLKPGNIRVWYGAVLAWLDAHVLGQPYARPELA